MHHFVGALHALIDSSASTTIPDDYLNLYPDDVPDNLGDLATTGFAVGPFFIAAIVLLVTGVATATARRRRKI